MKKPMVYSGLNLPPKVRVKCKGPDLARQSEKDSCDVNKIVARFKRTGELPIAVAPGVFADVSEVGSYHELVERVRVAEKVFAKMPSQVRSQFGNDPAVFLDAVTDPANQDKLAGWGLVPEAPGEGAGKGPEKAPEGA